MNINKKRPGKTLTRRQALVASIVAIGSAAVPQFFAKRNGSAEMVAGLTSRLFRILGSDALPGQLAAAGSSQNNVVADSALSLSKAFGVEPAELPRLHAMNDRELRSHLRERIAVDYREGSLRKMQGWWLSETEYHAFSWHAQLHRSAQLQSI